MSQSKQKFTKSRKEQQIMVLQEMLSKKALLFGKFNGTTTTKEEVHNCWKEIASLAQCLGLIVDNDEEKFRRMTWQNWRRNAVAKVDRMKKTGVGGASNQHLLDENDKIILAILGEEVAYGLDIAESDGANINVPLDQTHQPTSATPSNQNQAPPPLSQAPSNSHQRKRKSNDNNSEQEMRIKLMEISFYCKQLECRDREIKLDLPPSKFTESLYSDSER